MRPTPPRRLTPPITAAAMLSSMSVAPSVASPEPTRAVSSTPVTAARNEHMV